MRHRARHGLRLPCPHVPCSHRQCLCVSGWATQSSPAPLAPQLWAGRWTAALTCVPGCCTHFDAEQEGVDATPPPPDLSSSHTRTQAAPASAPDKSHSRSPYRLPKPMALAKCPHAARDPLTFGFIKLPPPGFTVRKPLNGWEGDSSPPRV